MTEFDEWFWPWANAQRSGTMLAHIPTARAAYNAGRNAALEAAAKVCDEQAEGQTNVYVFACLNNAVAIRALKHTPEQSNEVG